MEATEAALKWYWLLPGMKRLKIKNKYFPNIEFWKLNDDQIQHIYNSEKLSPCSKQN